MVAVGDEEGYVDEFIFFSGHMVAGQSGGGKICSGERTNRQNYSEIYEPSMNKLLDGSVKNKLSGAV
nr:hypothetical protein [Escherichia coli]QUN01835.1 hypothetical protein [Escherichia coli]